MKKLVLSEAKDEQAKLKSSMGEIKKKYQKNIY